MPSFALYTANRTIAVRNALVTQYMPLLQAVVASISKGRIKRGGQAYVCIEDLEAAGAAGLIRGVETFDPLRGIKPETYLSHKIRSAVLDELRRLDPLSRADRKLAKNPEAAATPQRRRAIEAGLQLGAAGSMTPAMQETLRGDGEIFPVKDFLRAAFKGVCPRTVYALILHRLEGMTMREVQAALVRRVRVNYVSSRTARILRTPPNALGPGVSEDADKKESHAKADRQIVATLLRGCPRSRRSDNPLHPRP